MQWSHVLSDLVLCIAGLAAVRICFQNLSRTMASLWAMFFVPVSLAALFGALRFAGIHDSMQSISAFFQQLATSLGSCGLILGAYGLISGKRVSPRIHLVFMAVGALFFLLIRFGDVGAIKTLLPVLTMLLVIAFGLTGFLTKKTIVGCWLLLAVVLSAASQWSLGNLSSPDMGIDVFHYVLAGSLISFALATRADGLVEA